MTKQEIINQCEASGIRYRLNNGRLAVFDVTQLPGGVRSQFDANGFFIEDVASLSPLTEPVEVVAPTLKRTRKELK